MKSTEERDGNVLVYVLVTVAMVVIQILWQKFCKDRVWTAA